MFRTNCHESSLARLCLKLKKSYQGHSFVNKNHLEIMPKTFIKHSDHFKTPKLKLRQHFSNSKRREFRKILRKYKVTKSGNKTHGFCKKIPGKDDRSFRNKVTDEPEFIEPAQISFLLHYGYLPVIDKSKKRDKLSISHRCGCSRCINPLHLLIEPFWKNIRRREHHKKIKRLAKSKNRRGSPKYYYLKHDDCNCEPCCFVSFN